MRWMRKEAALLPSETTLSLGRRTTASGLRLVRALTALPISWGPFTSTTMTFMPEKAPVTASTAALLPVASHTTATVTH